MPAVLCESMKSVSDSLSRWAENRRRWLAIGAVMLAALLPLPLLGRSLGIDETASVWFARFLLPDLLIRLCDPHPPGYYLVLKGWMALGEVEACLRLRDDGAGFDTSALGEQAASVKRGYGLQGLQERLELVRGQMSITSDTQTGTEITVIVPKHLGQLAAT